MSNSKYYGFIDVLRIVAMVAVVAIHTMSISVSSIDSLSVSTQAVVNTVHSIINFAVPVFLIITGYLFLGNEKTYTYKKMLKYIMRVFFALVIFGFIFSCMEYFMINKCFNLYTILYAFKSIVNGKIWTHMWYMYVIIGIYLIIPIIKPFFKTANLKTLIASVLILFLFIFTIPFIEQVSGMNIEFAIPIGGVGIFYVMTGGVIFKINFKPYYKWIAVGVSVAVLIYFIVIHLLYKNFAVADYNSIALCIYSIGIFIIAKEFIKSYQPKKILRRISKSTWGIYVIHPLFLNIQLKLLNINLFNVFTPFGLILNVLIITILTGFLVYFLRGSKFIRTKIL